MIINWYGKGNYIKDGDEIRRASGTELFSWYCTSINEVKRTFGIKYADVFDWRVLR